MSREDVLPGSGYSLVLIDIVEQAFQSACLFIVEYPLLRLQPVAQVYVRWVIGDSLHPAHRYQIEPDPKHQRLS